MQKYYVSLFICDNVIKVNDSTRVTIFGDSDSTRVTWRTMGTRVIINSQSRFYKVSEPLMDEPILFPHKQMSFFLHYWKRLAQTFCFDSLSVLHNILRIKCSQLA